MTKENRTSRFSWMKPRSPKKKWAPLFNPYTIGNEIPTEWWIKSDENEFKNSYEYFGDNILPEDSGDDVETDPFMNTMSSLLRELGTKDVEKLILKYFKDKTGNRSLRMGSGVFGKPTTKNLVMLNKMTVKLCLHDNWSSIRDIYPCLHDFKYHLVDVDVSYTVNYPTVNIETGIVYGVETVQNFADFVLDFIVKTCMPCVKNSSNHCAKMGDQMRKALEICKKTTCKDSRVKLLRFFLHHINKTDAAEDMVQDMDTDDMDVEPSSAMNLGLVPMAHQSTIGVPAVPDLLSQMATNSNRNVVVGGDSSEDWQHDMNPFINQSDRMMAIVSRAEEALKGVVENIEVAVHKNHVEDDSLVAAEASLKALTSDGYEMSRIDSIGVMTPVVNSRGVYFNLALEDDRIVLKRVVKDGVSIVISAETRAIIEENLNLMSDEIMSGKMTTMVQMMRKEMIGESPLNVSFEGGLDANGKWRTKYIVLVAGDKMRMSTVDKLVKIQNDKAEGPSGTTVFMEDRVNLVTDFVNTSHLVGEDVSASSQQGQGIMNKIGLNRFNIDGEPGEDLNPAAVAKAFTETMMEGSKYKTLNEFDQSVALFLVSEESLRENPAVVERMSVMLAKQSKIDEKLNRIKSNNPLEELILKSNLVNKTYIEDMNDARNAGGGQSEEYQVALRGMNGIDEFQKDIMVQMKASYARQGQSAFDRVAMRDNPRYAKVKEGRDALLDDSGSLKDNPSPQEVASFKLYEKKHALAKTIRMEGQSSLGFVGKLLRAEHHRDGFLDFPLGLGGLYKAIWGLKNTTEDASERDIINANIDAIFAGDQITTLENTDMSKILPYSRDEVFANEYFPDDLFANMSSPQAKNIFAQVGVFLASYLLINYLLGDSSGEGLDDERKKDTVRRNNQKRIIRNSLAVLFGGAFFTPVMVIGVLSLAGFRAKEGINQILDLLPFGGGGKKLDNGPSIADQIKAAEDENAEIQADTSLSVGRKTRPGARETVGLLRGRELRSRR